MLGSAFKLSVEVREIMEVEDCASSSGGTSDYEVHVLDTDDEDQSYTSCDTRKLQFRKYTSKARWNDELGMAEVVEKKGGMWTTTGIVRNSKTYCSIEEILYFAEIGALHLLNDDDTSFPLKDIYKKIADGKSGCCWESFEVYRHLKSLGYIVGRHGIPWAVKSVKSRAISLPGMPELNEREQNKSEGNDLTFELFNNMTLNEVRPTFDVFPPNSKFKKSSPGNPSFVLYLISGRPPSKQVLGDLDRQSRGIPLKFCHVVHGRVNFFSFNRVELPILP